MSAASPEAVFSNAVRGQPLIAPGRWYIGRTTGNTIPLDQPGVGFATEGECRMYIGNFGRHVITDDMVCVPAEQIQ
jgi:hypothetical protein